MNMKPIWNSRRGLTLLELIVASSMLAVVMTSMSLVLRSARTAWDVNDNDYAAVHHGTTVARHLVRRVREATQVLELPQSGESLAVLMPNGHSMRWRHAASDASGLSDVVLLHDSASGSESPLAYGIRDLKFVGFEADGLTPTTDLDRMQLLEVRVTVDTPNAAKPQQTMKSMVWIRSW